MSIAVEWAERGRLPDPVIRWGIRRLLRERLAQQDDALVSDAAQPLATHTDAANEQHYNVPPEFYESVLGPHRKYSCALFNDAGDSLDEAEARMLALTCARAGIADGMDILELGCGWGSLTFWMAEHYPRARIVSVSNAAEQRRYIEGESLRRGLGNIRVITEDINRFDPGRRFDRVISVEMFEHVRGHADLLARIADWLEPGGSLFVHHFCHRSRAYRYEDHGDRDWMARHFFSGGVMPAFDTLERAGDAMERVRKWQVGGTHYAHTCRRWLENLDRNRAAVAELFAQVYGPGDVNRRIQRWRMFFMACEELFAFNGGDEWFVAHVLMEPARGAARPAPTRLMEVAR
jgi:cyclopropane-fatty-acyl-phospholipid synthase